MTEVEIIKWIVMSVFGIVAWFFKRTLDDLETRIKHQDEELQNVKRNYLHRDDFKEFKAELRSMFEEIKSDLREFKQRHV